MVPGSCSSSTDGRNPTTNGGVASDTPFGFAGGYTDATALDYLIHRYYEPSIGQFVSVDPLVANTDAPYGYAGLIPTKVTDPNGLSTIGICLTAYILGAAGRSGSFGFLSDCIVYNLSTAVALTATEGKGWSNGLSGGVDVSFGFQSSSAGGPNDLNGLFHFNFVAASADYGLSAVHFWAPSGSPSGYNIEFGAGPSAGLAWGGGTSITQVFNLGFWPSIKYGASIFLGDAEPWLIPGLVKAAFASIGLRITE